MPTRWFQQCRFAWSAPRRAARVHPVAPWGAAIAVGTALAFHSAAARADAGTRVELDYDVGGVIGCPDVPEFQSSVSRQLGYDPFRPAAERKVAVRIAHKASGLTGFIEWSDASGRRVGDRQLSSSTPECAEIAAGLAFAVVVQIQLLDALAPDAPELQDANTAASDPPGSGAEGALAPPVAAPSAGPSEDDAAAKQRRRQAGGQPRFSAGLGPSVAIGLAPSPMVLGRLFAGVRFDALSLELAFEAGLPVAGSEPDRSGYSVGRFAGTGAGCAHLEPFAACVTAAVGRLQVTGKGVDEPRSSAGVFSQVGGRLSATHRLGDRYFAIARAEAAVMLSSWEVELNDAVVWTTPRVNGLAGLDVGVIF